MVRSSSTASSPNQNNDDTMNVRDTTKSHVVLYSILNLPKNADVNEIQRNYKLLSRVYHPDKTRTRTVGSNLISPIDDNENEENRNVDNSANDVVVSAQESFIAIKSAVDVLSDPIYRFAYDHYGELAVMIIKRSQQHSANEAAVNKTTKTAHKRHQRYGHRQDDSSNDNTKNEDDNTYEGSEDDLYTLLENVKDDEEAISILHEAIHDFRIQQQQQNHSNSSNKPKLNIVCNMPIICKEYGPYNNSTILHTDSISLSTHFRYPITNRMGVTVGTGSDIQRTAEASMITNLGMDYKPVIGTSINTNMSFNHHRSILQPDLSISTSRKCIDDTTLVAGMHGNVKNAQSWVTSLIVSKQLVLESIFGKSSFIPSLINCTIKCDLNRRLRGFMMSLRTNEWTIRTSLSLPYPIKISYRRGHNNDNNTDNDHKTSAYYITVSFGTMFPRIKLVRINGLGNTPWKIKYGLKHDTSAAFTKGARLSIICSLQNDDNCTIRIPIRVQSLTLASCITSIVIATCVDDQINNLKLNMFKSNNEKEMIKQEGGYYSYHSKILQTDISPYRFKTLVPQSMIIFHNIAKKKARNESKIEDGLVILQAILTTTQESTKFDITDTIQFWVINSKIQLQWDDPRLFWQIEQQSRRNSGNTDSKNNKTLLSLLWDSIYSLITSNKQNNEINDMANEPQSIDTATTLDVRYQYKCMTYQILFNNNIATDRTDNSCRYIELPNRNAIELGPSNRVR